VTRPQTTSVSVPIRSTLQIGSVQFPGEVCTVIGGSLGRPSFLLVSTAVMTNV
jgi:hypothetical protein